MTSGRNLVAAAFALTALSYGLARFAYGLLLPQIREALSLSATAAGWVGGGAFAAYCLGILLAVLLGPRRGERAVALLAGLAATAGMGLVALVSSGPVLGAALALAGLSTGLTSPPLAAAVARQFDAPARPRANGAINAGTAAGIVLSGAAAIGFTGAWRELYMGFALLGAGVTAWLWFAMPAGASRDRAAGLPLRRLARPGLAGLCAAALQMGASSTAVWTFGAEMLRGRFGFPDGQIAPIWIALGLGGLAGASTGLLVGRFGIGPVHRAALLGMALSYGALGSAASAPLLAYGAMALFGAAYIISSGVLLVWGTLLLAERPDLGLGLPFLMVALGQTLGAPLFGAVLDGAGAWSALSLSAALACAAMLWSAREAASTRQRRLARSSP